MSLTSTEFDVDLEVFTQLTENLDIACQHPSHETDKNRHKGSAEWIVIYPATKCGCPRMMRAVCDRWRRFVLSGALGLTCVHPGYLMSPEEMDQIVFEPLTKK